MLILLFSVFLVSGVSVAFEKEIESDFSSYIEERVHLRVEKAPDLYKLSKGSVATVDLIDDFGEKYEMKMLVSEGELLFFSRTDVNGIWKRVMY